MNPYVANLKTWYQCRPLWLWHILGAVICVPTIIRAVVRADEGMGFSFGILLVTFWLGTIVAFLAKDIQIKPFSFCLPGHGAVTREVIFIVGVGASAICSLVFLAYPTATTGETLAAMWSALTLGLIAYFAGLFVTIVLNRISFLPTMIALLLTVSFHDEVTVNFRIAAERTALGLPVATGLLALLVVTIAWLTLGARRTARRLCGESYLPPYSGLNVSTLMAYEREVKHKQFKRSSDGVMKILERFFISRMGKRSRRGGHNHFWGTLYCVTGSSLPVASINFFLLIFALLSLTVVLGYDHPERFPPGVSMANMLMFAVCIGIGGLQIIAPTGILLPVSRKSRFTGLLFAAFAYTIGAALFAALLIVVSGVVDRFAHNVVIAGRSFTYSPVIPKTLFFFLPMLPVLHAAQILIPRYYIIPLAIIALVYQIVFLAVVEEFLQMTALSVAVLYVVSWSPFVLLAHYYCYSRDVILKGNQ